MRDDTCVCCGAYVPEGRQVCYDCERRANEPTTLDNLILFNYNSHPARPIARLRCKLRRLVYGRGLSSQYGGDYMNTNNNRIVIPLSNGYQLVAEQNTATEYNKEIFIGITDDNGVWYQDLAIVRNAYYLNDKWQVEWKDEEFDVLVYSNENNEDFTHDFTVGLYKGGI